MNEAIKKPSTRLDAMDLAELVRELKHVARAAGEIELEFYNNGTETMHKSDGSPVTAADHAAEKVILEELARLTPDIPVVAEESVAAGIVPDVTGGTFWLVDPLDGTKEFVNRTGEFTVNIALLVDFKPVLGVIYAPVIDELYAAHGFGTATMSVGGAVDRPISVRTPDESGAGLTIVASRSHSASEKMAQYLEGRNVTSHQARGSSLKFCQIAAGIADFYPRLAPTSEWDTAAGEAIVHAAGGSVTQLDGSPMVYGKADAGFLNPYFIVRHPELAPPPQIFI